jgi:hypothetical protein
MRPRKGTRAVNLDWRTQARAALAQFNAAETPKSRIAALNKLRPLFAGEGALKEALRKCLKQANRVERLSTKQCKP